MTRRLQGRTGARCSTMSSVSEDYATFFESVAKNKTAPDDARKLAEELLTKWALGIIPSARSVQLLRDLLPKATTSCRRIEWDGACGWLRTSGARLGLPLPPLGERAMCPFVGSWEKCPGLLPP